jgi:hypothetical protein
LVVFVEWCILILTNQNFFLFYSLQLNIPAVASPDPKIPGKPEKEDEIQVAQGLLTWRRAVEMAQSAAQLHMCLVHLNNCIAWEKSIMKVVGVQAVSSTQSGLYIPC